MRSGWNPSRRNRHIGTKAQGHGADNRLVIPESWHRQKRYYEQLGASIRVSREVGSRMLDFFVEPPRPGWFYPCTVDDICAVLSGCKGEDLRCVEFIVMRQSTRKQRILNQVWGRAIWWFDLGRRGGRAVVIEAQSLKPIRWSASFGPEQARELERLRADGHEILTCRRGLEIRPTPASLRNTVLYRTLLHEIGHHVDFERSSCEAWGNKTSLQKEDFAHRYAQQTYASLEARGVVPFLPILDADLLVRDGLDVQWFRWT